MARDTRSAFPRALVPHEPVIAQAFDDAIQSFLNGACLPPARWPPERGLTYEFSGTGVRISVA